MSDSLNDYELNNVRELVKDLEEVIESIKSDIEGINETLDDHETRITDLEEE